jgi:large subunit ribosomal protein L23
MNQKNPRDVIIRPVISEKSYAANEVGVYTFVVAPDANKIEIRQAVEELFGKKVEKVATINRKGKRKRNRRTGTWGNRATQKRAIVTLSEGSIDILGG